MLLGLGGCWDPDRGDLVGDGDGHEALLERDGNAGGWDEHEATDVLAPGEDGQLGAVGWELEASTAVLAPSVTHRRHALDRAVATDAREAGVVVGREGLEAAVAERQQTAQLVLGGGDDVRRVRPGGRRLGMTEIPGTWRT